MKNHKIIILAIFVLTTMVFTYCEQGTEPEIIKPGRRDYTWTVDTLNIFATYLSKMWGSSPTDVWAVGYGGDGRENIWHYDGKKWTTDSVYTTTTWCVYGFSKDNVWVAGVDGDIWHYDGKIWNESLAYRRELGYKYYSNVLFEDIWGESPNNIYAVGMVDSVAEFQKFPPTRFGIIMHYNGKKWSRVNIGKNRRGIFSGIRKGYKTSNKYYIFNVIQTIGEIDSVKYFEFDGKKLKEIYYGGHNWHCYIDVINDEVIFTIGDGIYTYKNNSFHLIVENPYIQNYQGVYGRNKKDIIWPMSDGLTHYNGTDFKYILNFESYNLNDGHIRLRDGVVFDKEIFFVTNGNRNNYIFHGVLK